MHKPTLTLILTIATSLALGGCWITKSASGLITVKPTQFQLTEAHKSVICRSFTLIKFSGKSDSPETVAQIRRFNAALREICPTIK